MKIIQPQGPVVRRITIETDARGQVQVTAQNLLANTPLHPMEIAANLSQLVTQFLASLISNQPVSSGGNNGKNEKASD